MFLWGLTIFAFGLLTIGLALLSEEGESLVMPVTMLVVGTLVLWLLIRTERRIPEPLVPMSLFRDPVFSATNVMTLFLYGTVAAIRFLLPEIADTQHEPLEATFLHAYSVSMWVAAAWGILAALIAFWLLPKKAPV